MSGNRINTIRISGDFRNPSLVKMRLMNAVASCLNREALYDEDDVIFMLWEDLDALIGTLATDELRTTGRSITMEMDIGLLEMLEPDCYVMTHEEFLRKVLEGHWISNAYRQELVNELYKNLGGWWSDE